MNLFALVLTVNCEIMYEKKSKADFPVRKIYFSESALPFFFLFCFLFVSSSSSSPFFFFFIIFSDVVFSDVNSIKKNRDVSFTLARIVLILYTYKNNYTLLIEKEIQFDDRLFSLALQYTGAPNGSFRSIICSEGPKSPTIFLQGILTSNFRFKENFRPSVLGLVKISFRGPKKGQLRFLERK